MKFSTLSFFGIQTASSISTCPGRFSHCDRNTTYYNKDKGVIGTSVSKCTGNYDHCDWNTTYYDRNKGPIGTSVSKCTNRFTKNDWNNVSHADSSIYATNKRSYCDWNTTYYDNNRSVIGTSVSKCTYSFSHADWNTTYYNEAKGPLGTSVSKCAGSYDHCDWNTTFYDNSFYYDQQRWPIKTQVISTDVPQASASLAVESASKVSEVPVASSNKRLPYCLDPKFLREVSASLAAVSAYRASAVPVVSSSDGIFVQLPAKAEVKPVNSHTRLLSEKSRLDKRLSVSRNKKDNYCRCTIL